MDEPQTLTEWTVSIRRKAVAGGTLYETVVFSLQGEEHCEQFLLDHGTLLRTEANVLHHAIIDGLKGSYEAALIWLASQEV